MAFDGDEFAIKELVERGFLGKYGPGALDRLKRAAGLYTGEEKAGCHKVALANATTIDVEIAFSSTIEGADEADTVKNPRIDLLLLEPLGTTEARLVFWEAKAFSNAELGSQGSKLDPPVLGQIERYRAVISESRKALEESYTRVCADIQALRGAVGRNVHELIEEVAIGKRQITVGDEPSVNLLVFGFDKAQRDKWTKHKERLADRLAELGGRLKAVGDPKKARLRSTE